MRKKLIDMPDAPPQDRDLEEYVEERIFTNTIDSLEAHIDRKRAVADTLRYSILYLLYEFERLPRKELANATGKTNNGLQHHLRDLLDGNLIAEVPTPNDDDGRLTYYRITTLGQQEIEADIHNITGRRPDLEAWEEQPDLTHSNNPTLDVSADASSASQQTFQPEYTQSQFG